jgi:hypothetical protein
LDTNGQGTVTLSGGYYIVDVSGKYISIGVPSSGTVNFSELTGLTGSTPIYSSTLWYADLASFPATGGDATMYVAKATNTIYRWNGTAYVSLSGSGGTWGSITGTLSNQTDLQSALNAKQNTITNSDSIAQGGTNLFLNTAERTKLSNTSGTNTGDQTTITGNAGSATVLQTARNIDGVSFDGSTNITIIAPATNSSTSKATPVDADELPITDSATSFTLKKLTWANLKATLKTYFDSLTTTLTNKTLDLTNNTLTGTTAQFNTALSDGDFATLAGTETLTNKTLTSPIINTQISSTALNFDFLSGSTLNGAYRFKDASGNTRASIGLTAGSIDSVAGFTMTSIGSCGFVGSGVDFMPTQTIKWRVGAYGAFDLGITRPSPKTLKITDGGSGGGNLIASQVSSLLQSLAPTGVTQTIDFNSGSLVNLDLSSATGTVVLTLSNPQTATTYLIKVSQGATPRNLTFPTGTTQAGGGGVTYTGTANQKDIINVLYDGTNYFINATKNYS